MTSKAFVGALAGALMLAASFCSYPASAVTVDFEGFANGTALTNQIPGLTFTNALVLTAGVSLNETEFPPHSGVNAVVDNFGPITIQFASPESNVTGFFTYNTQLTLQAFDASNAVVATTLSTFAQNFVSSGNPPNNFLSLSGLNITKITITGDPAGGSFVLDDLSFTAATATPLPAALPLFATGIGGLGLLGWRRRWKVN
jgi:hypothetical protein